MSESGPFPGGNFFEGLLGDLMRIMRTEGPVNWDMARQVAVAVASGGKSEPNVDPLERIQLEELVRVAELHVGQVTGAAAGPGPLTPRCVTRAEWAWHSLEHWRSFIEAMAQALSVEGPAAGELGGPGEEDGEQGGLAELLSRWAVVMGPILVGLQFGSTLGHLAHRAMGQYDLPLPRPASGEILMIPANQRAFAEAWSLPPDDVRLWVCLSEVAHHWAIGQPHVRARIGDLVGSYAAGFRVDSSALEERLAGVDPNDPQALQRALGDPTAVLGELITEEQRRHLDHLAALVAALEGWVDHVVDRAGSRLISSFGLITEALRRHRVERGPSERFVERLFGLDLSQAQFDRGDRFVKGVLERAGEEALARLWQDAWNLPTPAEVDAPGLWLARLETSAGP